MDVDGYLPLVAPVVAAIAARPLAERLPPRTATWVLTVLATGLALSSMSTLLALADHMLPAAVVLAAGAAGAVYTGFGQVRALRAAGREARELPGDGPLAVVDDDRADAYAVPGRVVVSTGMLAVLNPGERRVLFAHEIAHLTGRHHVFRAVVRVASAANPLLWPLRGALWYATERWADERAAAAAGDRVAAARVIGKAALAHGPRPA
ncbi:M48 family metalloprotease, partial [Actinoallomurus bryophytorum]